jgi:hypothetical protein
MSYIRTSLNRIVIVGVIVTVSSCGGAPRTVEGECKEVFGAEVCTWGTVSGDKVLEFGATIPLAAVDSAPTDAPMVFPPVLVAAIRLPVEVREATGFDHLGVNWEAHGHPPALYMSPHFDFHFYTRSPAEIAAVDCSNREKPASLPNGYALPDIEIPGMGTLVGLCVPAMGMHAMPQADLDGMGPFRAAMLVGYYDRSVVALEPMVSRARLQEARSFVLDMPAVPNAGAVTAWPKGFEAVYDESARAYRFVFRTGSSSD